jgi:hypothetical protein
MNETFDKPGPRHRAESAALARPDRGRTDGKQGAHGGAAQDFVGREGPPNGDGSADPYEETSRSALNWSRTNARLAPPEYSGVRHGKSPHRQR